MRVWRICRSPYALDALSGEGARRYAGRWNSRGVPMVYSSTTLSLASIELFVHLEPGLAPRDLVYTSVELPKGEPARTIEPSELRADWFSDDSDEGIEATRALGDAWIKAKSSLALKVPAVPMRMEWNVLLNPLHPGIGKLKLEEPKPFIFDARMFQSIAR